jgi:hypothetical protein
MNNELGRIFKEADVAYFKVLPQICLKGKEENNEKPVRIASFRANKTLNSTDLVKMFGRGVVLDVFWTSPIYHCTTIKVEISEK